MYKQREKYLHVEGPEKANISGNANNVTNILLPVSLLSTRTFRVVVVAVATNRPTDRQLTGRRLFELACREHDSLTAKGWSFARQKLRMGASPLLHMLHPRRNNKMEIFGMFLFFFFSVARMLTEKNFDENINPFDGFLLNSKRRRRTCM